LSSAVLLIDPDNQAARMVSDIFANGGVTVTHACDAEEAAFRLREQLPNAIVLEWLLPGLSGVELARRLRAHPRTSDLPLLMLTSRDSEKDRLAGFESGVDDFLGKPFSPRELLARVRALIRRVDGTLESTVLRVGTLRLDARAQRVLCDGRDVPLGLTEFRLLELMMQRPNRVLNRSQIVDHLWGKRTLVSERTVDVHIRRLRKNLEETGYASRVQTMRGEGYVFVVRQEADPLHPDPIRD
jgi:two-component system phosphate regulon response regulator PhoB